MFQTFQQHKHIDVDERGLALMTQKTLKYFIIKDGVQLTPPPTKINLRYKGFTSIQNLNKISVNIQSLYLDHNSISQISGLEQLSALKCLHLNNNIIEKIINLNKLVNLQILNLSSNKIQCVSNLSQLVSLQTLDLSHNFLSNQISLMKLKQSKSLANLDCSSNQIACSEAVMKIFESLTNLNTLYLKSTPLNRGFKNYRRRLISKLSKLKFLDNRPVQEEDHRLAEAWMQGGIQFERQQKAKMISEKQQKMEQHLQQMKSRHRKQKQEKQKNLQEKINPLKKRLSQLDQKVQKTYEDKKEIVQLKLKIDNLKNPKGYIASVNNKQIKIMNVEDKEEEQAIIDEFFSTEKSQIEQNKKFQVQKRQFYEKQTEQALTQVQQMINKDQIQELDIGIKQKWNKKYEPILEALLQKYHFDFNQVQPSFNMILSDVNKKLMKTYRRFEAKELRIIWTQIQLRRRNQKL